LPGVAIPEPIVPWKRNLLPEACTFKDSRSNRSAA
jgi:hypothetical protein